MAGGRASTRTSYKEADSDDDWLAGDEEGATKVFEDLPLVKGAKGKAGGAKGRKRVGDTYGAGPRKKAKKSKGKGKAKATEGEDEPPFSLDLLFRLPNDLFLEICGYLDGRDLLEFSRTCKTMRKTLFSPYSGYIWANSRRRDDIPLPTGMTELELAALLYSNGCQICGNSTFYFRRQIELRFRSCGRCRKEHIIDNYAIRKTWPDLHPRATSCVLSNAQEYLVADLCQINDELLELEEEDELAAFAARASFKGSRSRSKPSPPTEQGLVDDFVAKKKAEVTVKQEENTRLLEAVDRERDRDYDERRRLRAAEEAEIKARAAELVDDYGWTEAQATRYEHDARWRYTPKSRNPAPTESPSVDEAGWLAFQSRLQEEIDREADDAKRDAAGERHNTALAPLYKAYCRTTSRNKVFLPPSHAFARLPTVKSWLGPDDPSFDAALWTSRLPEIEQALDDYAESLRVTAARKILSVTTGIPLSHLSTDSADYPEETYDAAFFEKPTSLFSAGSSGFSYYRSRQTRLVPFPNCLPDNTDRYYSPSAESAIAYGIDKRQVFLIRMIIDMVGLDEATATQGDLDAFGTRFRWTDAPSTKKRSRAYTWFDLVLTLNGAGPSLKHLKAGTLPEIEIAPLETSNNKKSLNDKRNSAADAASGDDDSASDMDSSSDAVSRADRGRRYRQADSSDEEESEVEQDEGAEEADEED